MTIFCQFVPWHTVSRMGIRKVLARLQGLCLGNKRENMVNAFGDVKELAGGNAGELDRFMPYMSVLRMGTH